MLVPKISKFTKLSHKYINILCSIILWAKGSFFSSCFTSTLCLWNLPKLHPIVFILFPNSQLSDVKAPEIFLEDSAQPQNCKVCFSENMKSYLTIYGGNSWPFPACWLETQATMSGSHRKQHLLASFQHSL